MERAKTVIEYYALCQKLKNLVRTGWGQWQVQGDRLESVAEHIYGTQMLAIAMYSEYHYEFDLEKVILMLAVHELEETVIGDITLFQLSQKEKKARGEEAVAEILAPLSLGEKLMALVREFDERTTPEAQFAYFCDKLECDLQAKLYDEEGRVDLHGQENLPEVADEYVRELLRSGKSWSKMWLEFGQNRYHYDENFLEVSNYAKSHKIKGDHHGKNDR